MTTHWYALRSKPRKEDIVWRQTINQGYEVFYPRLKVKPVNPRSRKLVPYFPGYLFIKVDIDLIGISTFQWMPYTVGLVTFGDEPAIVPESLIYAIKHRVSEIIAAGGELFDGLNKGDIVYIEEGPFSGYEAIFDARIPGTERVRVLLRFLNDKRQVPVELKAGQIKRVK
ncbi:MAG: transcription termination/antitermination NusG family protein [Anaerolineaceae bacterium]